MSDADIETRLRKVEDGLAIRQLILTYGPAADGGLADLASSIWSEDGGYDWDADQAPFESQHQIAAMLQADGHRSLIKNGVAHFAGPPLIRLGGDAATALTYSLVMRRDAERGRFYLWRVGAVRWDLERTSDGWAVRRRTNRLLDESSRGRDLFADALGDAQAADA